MLSGHSAAQEIKHMWKINQSFYWISNPQFWERSLSLSMASKQSCSALQTFSLRPYTKIFGT